jgi:hypothetical protein
MGHFKLMEDVNRELYKTKGYIQGTRMQRPKRALKFFLNKKIKKYYCCMKVSTMASSILVRTK